MSDSSQERKLWAIGVAITVALIMAAAAAVTAMGPNKAPKLHKAPFEVTQFAEDWPLPNKDYSSTRATTDSTITSANVMTLGQAWSYSIVGNSAFGGASCTPLILGDTVIFQDTNANTVALDFHTGAVKWTQMYNNPHIIGPNGAGVGYGKVFVAKDPYTIAALDINTGQEIWSNKLSYVNTTGIDIQPLVYDGKVYVSTVPGQGDVFYAAGGMGILYALDAETGDVDWTFNTVKDGYLWGHPEVNSGGGSWYAPSIDPKTGTMFWAVANPAPFAGTAAWPSGSSFDTALYTDSLLALNHDNGHLKWYTQLLHHDIWDHDVQISPILTKANISGVEQNIAITAGKMGYVYALNRDDGRLLWSVPVGKHMNDSLDPITGPTEVLPGVLGGVETPMAYSDGMVYVPIINLKTTYIPSGIASVDFAHGTGELAAIDVKYGHIVWKKDFNTINVGGATVVNDIVLTASFDGTIYALNKKTGEQLFTYKAPGGINAWPAVAGDTVIWPCGVGPQRAVIALKLGLHDPVPPEVRTYAKDWPLPNKDYSNTRSTEDSTINSQNVKDLGPAWSYKILATGAFGGATSTPLILGDTVIFQDTNANTVALDFQTGAVKWSQLYNDTHVIGPNGGGVGYGKVFVTKDPYTIAALNLQTGQEVWTKTISFVPTTGIDIQPLVYDGKVYTSTVPGQGDVFYAAGGMGEIFALDANTGDQMWSFNTVKDGNLWGHPEVNSGGGCWYPPSVDLSTGKIFWSVANPAPFAGTPDWPSGSSFDAALYTDSLLALNHTTGRLEWYSQALHHDIWDHDLQMPPILASANISGIQQDIVLTGGKMGYAYAMNREDGRMLWSVPVGEHVNDSLDPIYGPTEVLPGVVGGIETPMAYSEGMLYVPVLNVPTTYTPGGIDFSSFNLSRGDGALVAINVQYGHIAWMKDLRSINVGGATVVNDVVFTATFDGTIYAFNKYTGEELMTYKAPAGINAWPAVAGDTMIWPCGVGSQASVIALRLNTGPTVTITSPTDGSSVPGPDITVSVDVSRFTLVDKLGQPNVPGEGHLHYFLDVAPPTTPGVPAVTAPGTYVATTATSYTWTGLSAGEHMVSVELVNNDHTPLVPAAVATVYVHVNSSAPTLTITSPAEGAMISGSNVTISVLFTNFNLVNKLGQQSVPGEGHLHYFMDVTPPTAPGVPAITPSGTYAATTATSYQWTNVSPGMHMFSVELVNNDHTPLVPPVVAFVNVTTMSATGTVTIYLKAQNIAFNVSTLSVPAGSEVTLIFENLDSGIPHNFALYTDSTATTIVFQGALLVGPATTTYTFSAPTAAGTYFFRCDVHPTAMTGTFVVT